VREREGGEGETLESVGDGVVSMQEGVIGFFSSLLLSLYFPSLARPLCLSSSAALPVWDLVVFLFEEVVVAALGGAEARGEGLYEAGGVFWYEAAGVVHGDEVLVVEGVG